MLKRLAYLVCVVALIVAMVRVIGRRDLGWWYALAFLVAPDMPLVFGMGGEAPGRIKPAAVPFYNAVHRLIGPVALGAAAVWFSLGLFSGALAWAAHICIDRALGFRLRASDGSIRPA
jgi:hypothetical protein